MADPTEHLQFTEVLRATESRPDGCAIVTPEGKGEIVIVRDDHGCLVNASMTEDPTEEMGAALAHFGMATRSEDYTFRFGPGGGETVRVRGAVGSARQVEDAVRAALACASILWNVSPEKWLWVTHLEQSHRGPMRPPSVWPPTF